MFVLSNQCCGKFSHKSGSLLLMIATTLFCCVILSFELLIQEENSNNSTDVIIKLNTTRYTSKYYNDKMLNFALQRDLLLGNPKNNLWMDIPIAVIMGACFLGFFGILLNCAVLLLPYFVYRTLWVVLVSIIFLPFVITETILLTLMTFVPTLTGFLLIITFSLEFLGTALYVILILQLILIVLELHFALVVLVCYNDMKISKNEITIMSISNTEEAMTLLNTSVECKTYTSCEN
ncbi:hypothetical protein PGB90_006751 [Kerria lacca]